MLALGAGKPILVEKAFTLNARQARDVVAAARKAGLFCMEAMWMRFNPLIRQAVDLARDGAIGDLISIHADLSALFPFDPRHRLYDLAAGGGALLDLGVYPTTSGLDVPGPAQSRSGDRRALPHGLGRNVGPCNGVIPAASSRSCRARP